MAKGIALAGLLFFAFPAFGMIIGNQRVTKTQTDSCGSIPASVSSFVTTDNYVRLFLTAQMTLEDELYNDWVAPNGAVLPGSVWPRKSGLQCLGTHSLYTADLPATLLGTWQARVFNHNVMLFAPISFTVAPPPPPSPLQRWNMLSVVCQQGLSGALDTTGSSAATAATLRMAAYDRAVADKAALQSAAAAKGIDWRLLAAIGVRETGFRNISQPPPGEGRGVFQIDLGQNPSVTEEQAADPAFAAKWGANYLNASATAIKAKFPNLSATALNQAVADSYNEGTAGVIKLLSAGKAPDSGTTGKNYGSDVVNLIQCY